MKLIINGEPIPQGRPRFANRGKFTTTYDPPKSKAYKQLVRAQATQQWHSQPLSGALKCDVTIYRPIQQSGSKKLKLMKSSGQIRPIIKGDIDNYFKAVTDPLTGIVWVDDALIVESQIRKFYSNEPRVEIEVEELEQ
ncbi:RusA family crossover junction endodeoxyribonuclease [Lapidilactobacillus mulanensis]|uniref:RusA family crossover junction endodeoxyribonuclease n=1 Tax=Lapidilactobacillus mulanensis TaxID=2485999 RepID=A0ABW4DRJ7_9LACO|nr:RusA family crossover junction endodeoxyribonuclease [Lapidilactobacillus mulanensis]